jgi:hypothetical protein
VSGPVQHSDVVVAGLQISEELAAGDVVGGGLQISEELAATRPVKVSSARTRRCCRSGCLVETCSGG